jgi:hypothetical protein
MDAVVLVGRRAGQPDRDRNWRVASARWEQLGWPICQGFHNAEEGPYSMAVASNRAAALEDWDVCLYVGADFVLADLDQARRAVERATKTGMLTFAHTFLTLLEEEETNEAARTGVFRGAGTRHPNTFSGALAVPRSLWDKVGGFDERFVGWGWEDLAFWSACSAMGGSYDRVPGDMYHLWHPRSWEENEGAPEHSANMVLGERYLAAKTSQRDTLAILREPGGPLA